MVSCYTKEITTIRLPVIRPCVRPLQFIIIWKKTGTLTYRGISTGKSGKLLSDGSFNVTVHSLFFLLLFYLFALSDAIVFNLLIAMTFSRHVAEGITTYNGLVQ